MKKETKRKVGEWLLDVAKYLITAVLISSVFKDIGNKWMVYAISFVCVILIFLLGMRMYDKNSKDK